MLLQLRMQPDFTPVENVPPVAPQEPLNPWPPAEPVQPVVVTTPQALPPIHPVRWTRHSAFLAFMLLILAGSLLAILSNPVAMANIRDVAYLLAGMLSPSEKTSLVRSGNTPTPPPVAVVSPKPDPFASPDGRFMYLPPVGWEVVDESISMDGKTLAVVLTSVFPHSSGGNIVTDKSISRLILVDTSTKKEEILLERPVLTRTDILDGPRHMRTIGGVTWVQSRNSLIFTGHDTIEEVSLADKSLKTHFTFPRDAQGASSWVSFSGLYLPEYWSHLNALVFSQTEWEGVQTWMVTLDQGANATGVVVAQPGYEGPALEMIWDNNVIISDYCKTNTAETSPQDFCRELLVKSYPSLEQVGQVKFHRTNNVDFTRAGAYLLAAYSPMDGAVISQVGTDLQGREVQMWKPVTWPDYDAPGENVFYLKSVGMDLVVRDIATHKFSSPSEALYWEFQDSGAVVVTVVETSGNQGWKALRKLGEESYMVGAEENQP
jgi:hypothetical protein